MSATPQPWGVSPLGDVIDADGETVAYIGSEGLAGPLSGPQPREDADAHLIVRAVNAFAALLAVAKAAEESDLTDADGRARLRDRLAALDPDWREWTA
jgi:hypothetical protein